MTDVVIEELILPDTLDGAGGEDFRELIALFSNTFLSISNPPTAD